MDEADPEGGAGAVAAELYAAYPAFADALDQASVALDAHLDRPSRDVALGAAPATDPVLAAAAGFARSVALAALLGSFGLHAEEHRGTGGVARVAARYGAGALSLDAAAAQVVATARSGSDVDGSKAGTTTDGDAAAGTLTDRDAAAGTTTGGPVVELAIERLGADVRTGLVELLTQAHVAGASVDWSAALPALGVPTCRSSCPRTRSAGTSTGWRPTRSPCSPSPWPARTR